MKKQNSFIWLILTFFIACNYEKSDSIDGLVISTVAIVGCDDHFNPINFEKEFVIRTDKEFADFLNTINGKNVKCEAYTPIDFNSFTLIGKSVLCEGSCDFAFDRNFFKTKEGKYKYEITVKYEGNCDSKTISLNFVLVPKIESNATVDFEVIR